ncbi:MAG: CHAT domain-containing protein [Oscillatoriales cyanobacterium C42_A2020_001]|nr:CHAT domain-containing protein [Leptolyngbyaceae cyanobacterium C42_A2020_001]
MVPSWKFLDKRVLRYCCLSICAALAAITLSFAPGQKALSTIATDLEASNANVPIAQATTDPVQLTQSGKARFQAGQFASAVRMWQQATQEFSRRGDRLNQAAVLSNLALAYQQLGQWAEANAAIADSLKILRSQDSELGSQKQETQKLLAQTLNIQGGLQLAQGQTEQALTTWQAATKTYQQIEEAAGVTRSLINQTQAYRALGLYPRAKSTLAEVNQVLQQQPDSQLKAAGLVNYGDALRLVGELDESEKVLQQSLAIAQRLQSPPDITLALLSLGNTARAQQSPTTALAYYQQAIAVADTPANVVQAQLNQLRLLIETQQLQAAQSLVPTIRSQLETLPPSRIAVYARVNFTQSVMRLDSAISSTQLAQLLAGGAQLAKESGDQRAESYALGYLGELYERNQQLTEAKTLTDKALLLSQLGNAPEISYRWQWQLGRILRSQGQLESAVAAYRQAVKTLQSIRNELVASSPDIQFSFRESVEPVYREFVALLLEPSNGQEASQANLREAREVIESLQLAELDNFFKEACLTSNPTPLDKVDPQNTSAVIYPIILPNRLEVVVSIPNQPLSHHASAISQRDLEQLADQMRRSLRRTSTSKERLEVAQKLYSLLIRPAEAELTSNNIQTLAFVLDGSLKNLPMAALHDGRKYLLEKYSIALTPGLQLIDPRPLQQQQLKVLVGALSEERQGFSALPGVETEIQQIKTEVPSQVLFNQTFTTSTFQQQVSATPYRVVHLATHGQFSSNADETFILTWDRRIDVKQLGELLQAREQEARIPIELLVLSACQTAEGDKRAALGLAGVAVRSGARSTLATLWAVDDQSTSQLMVQFYQELARSGTTKAEALRQSQIKLLQTRQFRHPFYWAPFVLIGNWL